MNNRVQEWLDFFLDNKIAIQITLDLDRKPTVHALYQTDEGIRDVMMAEGDTILEALELINKKIFG